MRIAFSIAIAAGLATMGLAAPASAQPRPGWDHHRGWDRGHHRGWDRRADRHHRDRRWERRAHYRGHGRPAPRGYYGRHY